ncbi:MAG: NAD(P)H-dependent glycerol-3-phosphate dehydrogenase [Gammaproteobacteria bacterium]
MFDMTEGFDPNPPAPAPHGHTPLACAAVLGAGAWGTALASALQRGGVPTWLWARRQAVAEAIHSRNHHPHCLSGIALPSGLGATHDMAHAVHGAQLVILAVPSAVTRDLARQVAPLLKPGTVVLTASKGIEQGSGALMTQVLDAELGQTVLTGSIGGPSFADEVAGGKSTLLTLALPALERFHPRYKDARRVADGLTQQLALAGISLELTRDVVGAQVGGALKNMIAIACGMATAQDLGENARAGIITRGLDDMRRLTLAMGGRIETLFGSSGIGDLFLTAASEQSRNTRLGMRLGQAGGAVVPDDGALSEGAVSVLSVQVLERKYGLRLNVAAAVRDVLQQRAPAGQALQRLLHDSAPAVLPPAPRTPRPATVRPRIGRDSETRPAVQPWGLSYA